MKKLSLNWPTFLELFDKFEFKGILLEQVRNFFDKSGTGSSRLPWCKGHKVSLLLYSGVNRG